MQIQSAVIFLLPKVRTKFKVLKSNQKQKYNPSWNGIPDTIG